MITWFQRARPNPSIIVARSLCTLYTLCAPCTIAPRVLHFSAVHIITWIDQSYLENWPVMLNVIGISHFWTINLQFTAYALPILPCTMTMMSWWCHHVLLNYAIPLLICAASFLQVMVLAISIPWVYIAAIEVAIRVLILRLQIVYKCCGSHHKGSL